MKLQTDPFASDYLALTRWELVKLFFGFTVEADALIVSTRPCKERP